MHSYSDRLCYIVLYYFKVNVQIKEININYGVSFPLNAFLYHFYFDILCIILSMKQGIPVETIDSLLVRARGGCY
jgi:hypothetical protein